MKEADWPRSYPTAQAKTDASREAAALPLASMQRSTTAASNSSSPSSSATTALRRTLRSTPSTSNFYPSSRTRGQGQGQHDSDEDDFIADPRPWESRAPLKSYGSAAEGGQPDLPLYTSTGHNSSNSINNPEMEARRRYGEKEEVVAGQSSAARPEEEKELLDDQGKWMKGYGPGPGIGGRRGLPPRQRIPGWVSRKAARHVGSGADGSAGSWSSTKNGSGRGYIPFYHYSRDFGGLELQTMWSGMR